MQCKVCSNKINNAYYTEKYCSNCRKAYRQGYKAGWEQSKAKFQKMQNKGDEVENIS